jgi:hypothetical protein
MFDYLQKFNSLPQNLRDSVSSPAAMTVISDLENKYKIDLAATVMKVMTKIIPLADLSIYFVSDFSLDQETSKKLTADLKEKLFFPVANYLGYNVSYSSVMPKTEPLNSIKQVAKVSPVITLLDTTNKIIKESGIVFSSLDLSYRFKNILDTYLRGIRNRVDARLTFGKEIVAGGLGLDQKTIDKIFRLCDNARASQILPSGELESLPSGEMISLPAAPIKSGLEAVRSLYEKPNEVRDIPYDLQTAIKKGEIKKPVTNLNLPIPEEAKEKLLVKPVVIVKEKSINEKLTFKVEEPIKMSPPVAVIVPPILTAPLIPLTNVFKAKEAVNNILKLTPEVKPIIETDTKKLVVDGKQPEKKLNFFAKLFKPKEQKLPTASTKINIPNVSVNEAISPIPQVIAPIKPVTPIITSVIKPNPVVLAPVIPAIKVNLNPTPIIPAVKVAPVPVPVPVSKPNLVINNEVEVKTTPKVILPITTLRTAAAAPQASNNLRVEPVAVTRTPDVIIPRTMGPLEELRYLNIINFRRLGSSPKEATAKIESKIRLLEKDGYDHMISGVLAWRDSAINLLYLKMGLDSLNKNTSLKQYADDCQTAKTENVLIWEEIEEIMKLNSRLMF